MKHQIFSIAALGVLLGAIPPAVGDVVHCSVMQADLDKLKDGSLFYRPHTFRLGSAWKQFLPGDAFEITRPTPVDFIYVAREYWLESRPGMIVVKTGRVSLSDKSQPGPELIGLHRIESGEGLEDPTCRKTDTYHNKVLGESYDRYHDVGGRIPLRDKTILGEFHSNYLGRGERCSASDSLTGDTYFGRSNRGQFSFADSIVAGNLKEQLIAAIGTPLYAANGYSDRSVEVHRYRTDKNRVACVKFTLTVGKPNFFLKINDLERVKGSEQYPERGDETKWNLGRQ